MRIIRKFNEAIDLTRINISVDKILEKDLLVNAWHGTSYYWAMYLCYYGIQGDSPAPAKTLGQGNNQTGYVRTSDSGLYVSPKKIMTMVNFIKIEVKPSELAIPREMLGRNCNSGLEALIKEEAIIVKKIPAKRIVSVEFEGNIYSRSQFLALEENPKDFLYVNRDNNFYQSGDLTLLGRMEKDNLFSYLKTRIKQGVDVEDLLFGIEDMIKYKDYEPRGLSLKDMEEIKNWLLSKNLNGGKFK